MMDPSGMHDPAASLVALHGNLVSTGNDFRSVAGAYAGKANSGDLEKISGFAVLLDTVAGYIASECMSLFNAIPGKIDGKARDTKPSFPGTMHAWDGEITKHVVAIHDAITITTKQLMYHVDINVIMVNLMIIDDDVRTPKYTCDVANKLRDRIPKAFAFIDVTVKVIESFLKERGIDVYR